MAVLQDAHTRAAATPASRNRVVDFWRAAAICIVVLGHWLAAGIWVQPDGEIALLNALEWIPYAAWVTWAVQVMPVFFLAGGFANARGLRHVDSGDLTARSWVVTRARRLVTPVVPLLSVWVVTILLLRPVAPHEVIYAAAMSATVPLWFLSVYVALTAAAPVAHAWWRRWRLGSVAILALAALTVDVARSSTDVTAIGYVNFLFVWGAVHQLGFWWADREQGGIPRRTGWAVAALALIALVAVTWGGLFPVAMIGVGPDGANMTPPTSALLLLALVQAGVIWATQPAIRRLTARPRVWQGVVAVSGVVMTVYLWHLSAMSLLAAVGLLAFDGAAFAIEPGTTLWWSSRPVWIVALLAVTAVLVGVFGRFERWTSAARPPPRPQLAVGVLLFVAATAGVASYGITTPDAVINWILPGSALLGAALLGALPQRPGRGPATAPPERTEVRAPADDPRA